jgi:hypothetical protein
MLHLLIENAGRPRKYALCTPWKRYYLQTSTGRSGGVLLVAAQRARICAVSRANFSFAIVALVAKSTAMRGNGGGDITTRAGPLRDSGCKFLRTLVRALNTACRCACGSLFTISRSLCSTSSVSESSSSVTAACDAPGRFPSPPVEGWTLLVGSDPNTTGGFHLRCSTPSIKGCCAGNGRVNVRYTPAIAGNPEPGGTMVTEGPAVPSVPSNSL